MLIQGKFKNGLGLEIGLKTKLEAMALFFRSETEWLIEELFIILAIIVLMIFIRCRLALGELLVLFLC
jgi:hypothetical protein